jgi:hypothetical protein
MGYDCYKPIHDLDIYLYNTDITGSYVDFQLLKMLKLGKN